MKLLREPLLHFLLIGAAFFLYYHMFSGPAQDRDGKTIVVGAAEIEWMRASWQQRWNRPPMPDELDGMIEDYIRETVLYREALALGLDKDDRFIRQRLGLKMEFLAADLVTLAPPAEDELRAYFEAHRERYKEPPRFTFTQVYFDPDKRGKTTLEDAEAARTRLDGGDGEIADPGSLGDSLMLGNDFIDRDQADIRNIFGSVFAQTLASLSPGQWHGPVSSGYGVHLVYVSSVYEPTSPDFNAIRERLVQDWTADKGDELKKRFYAGLRDQYTVIVERPISGDEPAAASVASE